MARKGGRRKGGRKRGYYYRANRGWCVMDGKRSIQLYDELGEKLVARNAPVEVIEAAYRKYQESRREHVERMQSGDTLLVAEVCRQFLECCAKENRSGTLTIRSRYLFDFCTGYPARFKDCPEKATAKDRIHGGYGKFRVADLTVRHVNEWVAAHKEWDGRMPKQAVKRVFYWAASEDVQLIKTNPVLGMKVGKPKARVTYFTPEQEKLFCGSTNDSLALVIRVLIRTGVRPSELCKLTARHVEDTSKGQVWRLAPHEHKTGHSGKWRVIRVAQEVAEIVRELIKKHPTGALFRSPTGLPWTPTRLHDEFGDVKKKLNSDGHEFAKDDCLYSCRHTFAKRLLGGYWTGKPATIETVAGAMGNSRQVAWETYSKWCESYDDPLWEALG